MNITRSRLLAGAVASAIAAATSVPALAQTADFAGSRGVVHSVFVMTNNADQNEILAYERTDYGTLSAPHAYKTGGRGSGGLIDPLQSQGSLVLSDDHNFLFAINSGSGTLSVLAIVGAQLVLLDTVPTGGSEPVALAQHGNLLYVLNGGGSSSVVGFSVRNGKFSQIPNSRRFLSGTHAGPGSVAFSPNGKSLVVAERVAPSIDVFSVLPDGTLSTITINKNVGVGTFSVAFDANGIALAAETGSGGTTSAISSYSIQTNGTLLPVSASVPTLGGAACWDATTPNGGFVYVSNSASSTLSGFAVGGTGALTALPGTVVAANPAGSVNLDVTVSLDGNFLYTLNSGGGTVGMFAIAPTTGTLTNLGTVGGVAASAGFNGIVAN